MKCSKNKQQQQKKILAFIGIQVEALKKVKLEKKERKKYSKIIKIKLSKTTK